MSRIEEILNNKKIDLDELKVPEELESRLNNALKNKSFNRKRSRSWGVKVAMLLIAFVLVTYNIDTLAFYGRELLGFDNIMNGTLKELNEMGMGQAVERSYTFSNGAKVTLNGVMVDDNQLLAFYTIEDKNGNIDELNFNSMYVKGVIGRHYKESAQGEVNKDETIIRWVEKFEPPYAFEKHLAWTFNMMVNGKNEEGRISFVLDRDKAMGNTLKTRLNETIKIDGTEIRFDEITASPTATVVIGTLQNIFELAGKEMSGERIYSPMLRVELLANGKVVQNQGAGVSTGMKGTKFDIRYDALPQNLEKLQLHLTSFVGDYEVNELVRLNNDLVGKTIQIKGQDVLIDKIDRKNEETVITITTTNTVTLSKVYLLAGNNRVDLSETTDYTFDKKEDGTVTKTRTLRFKTTAENLQLEIKRIRYEKLYDEYVDISLD